MPVRENEMGDFLQPPPGHGAEYDRLRRRFERYRQLHASRQQQYDSFASGVYNQQAQETQLLHRRWQDSKKPTAKSTASAKISSRAGDAMPGAMPTSAASVTAVCRRSLLLPANECGNMSAVIDTSPILDSSATLTVRIDIRLFIPLLLYL